MRPDTLDAFVSASWVMRQRTTSTAAGSGGSSAKASRVICGATPGAKPATSGAWQTPLRNNQGTTPRRSETPPPRCPRRSRTRDLGAISAACQDPAPEEQLLTAQILY